MKHTRLSRFDHGNRVVRLDAAIDVITDLLRFALSDQDKAALHKALSELRWTAARWSWEAKPAVRRALTNHDRSLKRQGKRPVPLYPKGT